MRMLHELARECRVSNSLIYKLEHEGVIRPPTREKQRRRFYTEDEFEAAKIRVLLRVFVPHNALDRNERIDEHLGWAAQQLVWLKGKY